MTKTENKGLRGLLLKLGIGKKRQLVMEFLQKGACVLDVREVQEYQGGHAPGSLNIPLAKLRENLGKLEKKGCKQALVCCRSGMRAGMATQILRQQGISCINVGSWQNAANYVEQFKKPS